jgi:hypothetical protein
MRTVSSSEALASRLPAGLNATLDTARVCVVREVFCLLMPASQMHTVPSLKSVPQLQLAMRRPSGLKATDQTGEG